MEHGDVRFSGSGVLVGKCGEHAREDVAEKRTFVPLMGRILAIDYGTKRTGIAVSDPLRVIAGGLDTVPTAQLLGWLARYMGAEPVDIIVVGRPTRTDGSPSDTLAAAEALVAKLRAGYPGKTVTMFDERFTSVLAHRAMLDGGMKKMQRRDKAVVDKISATILLQDFMESRAYALLNDNDTQS